MLAKGGTVLSISVRLGGLWDPVTSSHSEIQLADTRVHTTDRKWDYGCHLGGRSWVGVVVTKAHHVVWELGSSCSPNTSPP